MDAPAIQYCKTSDGVSIAYWTLGEGRIPLVLQPPQVVGHIGLEWEDEYLRGWYEELAGRRLVVRYDPRNSGLSDRNVEDVSLEADIRDLGAVVERSNLQRFALMSFGGGTPSAMAYAAQHPSRVTHLILSNPMVQSSVPWSYPVFGEVLPLLETDWRLFTETMAHVTLGWGRGGIAHDWARFIRRATTQEDFKRRLEADANASPFLDRVEAPTLILYSKRYPVEIAQPIASGIPSARLVQLPADIPFGLDRHSRQLVEEFLAAGESERDEVVGPSGMTAILYADIADSTALTERMGDAAFRERSRQLEEVLRQVVREGGGAAVDGRTLGDGVLATFASAREAIEAGTRCARAGDEVELPLHVGIHAGDVIREEGNVYGGAVNIAARISDAAGAGEVLVSDVVRGLARTSAGVAFEDRGERTLKGIDEAVRVWAVVEA